MPRRRGSELEVRIRATPSFINRLLVFAIAIISSCKTSVEPLDTEQVSVQPPSDSSVVYISYKNMMLQRQQMFVTTDYINSNLVQGYGLADWPVWSPEKREIAYTLGGSMLWVMRYDGENARMLGQAFDYLTSPRWSHNGRRLAIIAVFKGAMGCYLIDSSGGNLRRVADTSLIPRWSLMGFAYVDWMRGDSSLLIGYSQLDSPYVSSSIGILYLNSGRFFQVSNLEYLAPSQPRASPTRDEMVFIGNDHLGYNGKLYRANLDGYGVVKLCDAWECQEPCWSRDGERIMFLKRDGDTLPLAIWVINRDGTNLREIFGTEGFHVLEPDW
ncbi:MAG: hypothetical protein M1470_03395 [Bacteroidetes bacterium]|nr:hypothetical protein [Bacteroidota bacterium]MCL5737787.1 hypothetical protein [Bacteroidota bacterium]